MAKRLLALWLVVWCSEPGPLTAQDSATVQDAAAGRKQTLVETDAASPHAARHAADDPTLQPLSAAIHVDLSTDCLEQGPLVAHVRMWLGREQIGSDTRVDVHGVAQRRHAVSFDVTHAGTTRRRTFDPRPENCDEAHAVLGLAIALALDEPHTQDLLRAALPAPPRVRRLGLQVGVAYGVLAGVALAAQLGTELAAASWFSVRADALSLSAFRQAIPYSEGRFDAWLISGSLQACAGGLLEPRVRLALCTGPAAGAIRAWGHGYKPDSHATGFWLGVRSGLRLDFTLGLRWLVDLEVISGIFSPAFGSRPRLGEPLKRKPDAAGVAFSLGPALSF